jgi:hypothetical protein
MGKFTDTKGRQWPIVITIGTTMRLEKAGIDFYSLAANRCEQLLELHHNHTKFARFLWPVVEPDAKREGITEEEFYEAIFGDPLAEAWEAFKEAYIGFFPSPENRSGMKRFFEGMGKIEVEMVQEAIQQQQKALAAVRQSALTWMRKRANQELSSEQLEELLDQAMNGTRPSSGGTSGAGADSCGSTPSPTPSAKSG